MAIVTHPFTLVQKKILTHDVFELHFQAESELPCKPGQYLLFTLNSGLKRSYSIAYKDGTNYMLIIKRLENGGGGSKEICDLEIGAVIHAMSPIGHFTLTEGDIPRLFIGTGTGFAPLYFQVRALEDRGFNAKTHFVFGVRAGEDLFYQDELRATEDRNAHFTFSQYLSREEKPGFTQGYVTAFLENTEEVLTFQEFYICGSPVMVKDVRAKLEALGIEKTAIKFEQF
ncbi:MAG: ferredoxin--NADP reductase [Patescibacteria group bacterium]